MPFFRGLCVTSKYLINKQTFSPGESARKTSAYEKLLSFQKFRKKGVLFHLRAMPKSKYDIRGIACPSSFFVCGT